ncbi:TetR/AcrR family transcriptional regulator [Chitinophaga pinensis]|uniref:Transcriptional regulator, TetR family n=1 Tax=Chitinophaga pinensis (strain ATCC 43595 / DSM 2588 / LMG 13176 / NBRC 15968 / NCIMB 11800 / UQM 2034) TaxID=485918 RepID=A0A979H168_CHIPD|nr:TetR family transcriptional regulator C-terminal domain-containing protein [Chitinophaga pinensis]ACU64100.1 transcriptional regulator, TetR family [Chitinophaga pinensis DSM 2588]
MKGRPSTFDHARVVEKAQSVFWQKGFAATSLDDLLKATEMGSGSFYNTFKGGKKELFSKAIQQRRQAFMDFKVLLKNSASPITEIRNFFLSLATASEQEHLKGCIVSNTVVEMTFLDEELEEEAVTILKEVEMMFAAAIKKGQESGEIKNQDTPELLARYLITVWNGLNITRRMYPSKQALQKLIEMQLSVIS